VINMLCDHCLLLAYANQTTEIDADIAARAITYLEEGESTRPLQRRLRVVRPAIGGLSRRAVVAYSAAAAAVAATVGFVSPAAYHSALNAVSATMGGPIGGVVRWLTTWWGS
jgi:hypothetical protein